jgi:hypothetical protein
LASRVLVATKHDGSKISPQQQRVTAVHELLHAAFHGSSISALKDQWNDDIEEAVCLALEGPLLELFTRPENGPARRWLMS